MQTAEPREALTAKRTSAYAFGVAFVASVGGFLFGYDLSVMGGANLYLRDQFHLSPAALGFATASATLGCIVGPFLGGWLCDVLGRTRTMMVACALLGIGAIFTGWPDHALALWLTGGSSVMTSFNIFRIVGGVGVGLCSVASPMYISETAPPRMRGGLGTMYQLAIVVGSITAPFVSWLIAKNVSDATAWRWMFASEIVPVVIFIVLLWFLPQSPRWLANKGRDQEALEVLSSVDGPDFAKQEMAAIKTSLAEEPGTFSELFSPGLRYALLIGILLAFFNNWTGWSVMGGYIPLLLEASGLKDRSAQVLQYTLSYGAMGVVTLIACWTVDKAGRRPLWLLGSALMAAITFLTGLVFHFHWTGGIVLLVLVLCTVPHGIALGPLPWLMMSEIFPNRVRGRAVALNTAFLWITIYSAAQLFPIMDAASRKAIGSAGGVFWLFTVVCIAAFWFGWRILPETKGRTLEEIAASWKKKH
jgi:SP family arabinose:H+ symporter-like MFS transporter